MKIKINTKYIQLQQLLKKQGFISTGGEIKYFIINNDIYVNYDKENRRGRKLYPGDKIKINNKEFEICI